MRIEIEVPKELFRKIKWMSDEEFNESLLYRLKSLYLDLEESNSNALEKKINEVRERIKVMKEEIARFKEFKSRALEDKKKIEEMIDLLSKENERLMEMVRDGRNRGEGGENKEKNVQAQGRS